MNVSYERAHHDGPITPIGLPKESTEADTRKNGLRSLGNTAAATPEEISGESKGLTELFEAGRISLR